MPPKYHVDLSAAELVKFALGLERDSVLSARGALCVLSYEKTGRSPADKRIVDTEDVRDTVDWGNVNIKLPESSFQRLKEQATGFLEKSDNVFVVNAFAGHDPRLQLRVRILTTRPYHALFMRNMLVVPSEEQLKDFKPDFTIFNAGECWADPTIPGLTSKTCVAVNFKTHEQVILGTQYAGEMKKGILTVMFELMPRIGHLTMHASANEGKQGDVTIFFGLSGTGKTTLSADPNRALIGDDEHVWTSEGVFNVEGGCYAKAIGLNPKTEFEIWSAVRFGALAENCVLRGRDKEIDFMDESICKNTRVAYPLHYIEGSKSVAVGGHPKNIIFLTNDAFGVMPPVSQLSPSQSMFWFVTGYTASVPGVVAGESMKTAKPTFSPCFGGPFLTRHPTFYGEQLAKKMKEHNVKVWLVNTGYAGGRADRGARRMPLKVTRAILDAIHSGQLEDAEYQTMPGWNLRIPKAIPNVPGKLINPATAWSDAEGYVATTNELIAMFQANFQKRFASKASAEMMSAMPQLLTPSGNSKL